MKEYLEKSETRYVIATFDNPTNYLVAKGNGHYMFIDNIKMASKYVKKSYADEVCNACRKNYSFDLVVVKLRVDYKLIEEE